MPPESRPDTPVLQELTSRDSAPVRIGDVLAGKYRVERVLGMGGMGVVVAATHLQLQQRVALKFLLPAAVANEELHERFLREARAAVRLKSEHVAKVLDVGTLLPPGAPADSDAGVPYIVMEYLEGRSLGELIREQTPFSVAESVGYVLQACEAVAEAHACGIVHRDLKPDNLFLTRRVDGQPLVKVLDFGISKTLGPNAGSLSLTRTFTVMGSPLYMSPEQLRSAKSADFRSDIWALGVILYELTTGRVPFRAETYSELCFKVVQDSPVPAIELRPDVPPGLNAVILRCLEKDPANRFPNVGELATALAAFAPESMREMANRVNLVVGGGATNPARPPMASVASFSEPANAREDPPAQTGVTWGQTKNEKNKRWRTLAATVGGASVVMVVGSVVFVSELRGRALGSGASSEAASVQAAEEPIPAAATSTSPSTSPSTETNVPPVNAAVTTETEAPTTSAALDAASVKPKEAPRRPVVSTQVLSPQGTSKAPASPSRAPAGLPPIVRERN